MPSVPFWAMSSIMPVMRSGALTPRSLRISLVSGGKTRFNEPSSCFSERIVAPNPEIMTTGEWPQVHLVAAAAVEANTEQSITAAMTMQSIRLNGFFFILLSQAHMCNRKIIHYFYKIVNNLFIPFFDTMVPCNAYGQN